MRVEAASSEFSSNSFTTEAGRSTTSPAAILLATVSERTWMRPMLRDPSLHSGFRPRAPAALTPGNRLNLASSDLIGDGFGQNVDASHAKRSLAALGISAAGSRCAHARKSPQLRQQRSCWPRFRTERGCVPWVVLGSRFSVLGSRFSVLSSRAENNSGAVVSFADEGVEGKD